MYFQIFGEEESTDEPPIRQTDEQTEPRVEARARSLHGDNDDGSRVYVGKVGGDQDGEFGSRTFRFPARLFEHDASWMLPTVRQAQRRRPAALSEPALSNSKQTEPKSTAKVDHKKMEINLFFRKLFQFFRKITLFV